MMDKIVVAITLFCCITVVTCSTRCTKYNSNLGYDHSIYCSTSCCGTSYDRYCCKSTSGATVGIVVGVLSLVAIGVIVFVVVCCCCRRSRGQQGQVCQPATIAQVYGVQTTTVTGYGQTGYNNTAFPQQLQTTNVAGNGGQNWQPPPPYTAVNTS